MSLLLQKAEEAYNYVSQIPIVKKGMKILAEHDNYKIYAIRNIKDVLYFMRDKFGYQDTLKQLDTNVMLLKEVQNCPYDYETCKKYPQYGVTSFLHNSIIKCTKQIVECLDIASQKCTEITNDVENAKVAIKDISEVKTATPVQSRVANAIRNALLYSADAVCKCLHDCYITVRAPFYTVNGKVLHVEKASNQTLNKFGTNYRNSLFKTSVQYSPSCEETEHSCISSSLEKYGGGYEWSTYVCYSSILNVPQTSTNFIENYKFVGGTTEYSLPFDKLLITYGTGLYTESDTVYALIFFTSPLKTYSEYYYVTFQGFRIELSSSNLNDSLIKTGQILLNKTLTNVSNFNMYAVIENETLKEIVVEVCYDTGDCIPLFSISFDYMKIYIKAILPVQTEFSISYINGHVSVGWFFLGYQTNIQHHNYEYYCYFNNFYNDKVIYLEFEQTYSKYVATYKDQFYNFNVNIEFIIFNLNKTNRIFKEFSMDKMLLMININSYKEQYINYKTYIFEPPNNTKPYIFFANYSDLVQFSYSYYSSNVVYGIVGVLIYFTTNLFENYNFASVYVYEDFSYIKRFTIALDFKYLNLQINYIGNEAYMTFGDMYNILTTNQIMYFILLYAVRETNSDLVFTTGFYFDLTELYYDNGTVNIALIDSSKESLVLFKPCES